MKVSELILKLQEFKETYGDLEVDYLGPGDERIPCKTPKRDYRKVLDPGETRDDFWYRCDGIKRRGQTVCRL